MQGSVRNQSAFECFGIAVRLCILLLMMSFVFSSSVYANKQSKELINTLETLTLPMMHEVNQVYQSRDYKLIWSDGVEYNDRAHQLRKVIRNARKLGLNPTDYDLEIIEYFLDTKIEDPRIVSKSDVTLTHAYIRLAANIDQHKYQGISQLDVNYGLLEDPIFINDVFDSNYKIAKHTSVTKGTDTAYDLKKPIAAEHHEIEVHAKQSNQDHYSKLLSAIEKFRSANDNFEPIKLPKKSLAIGDISEEIAKTRKRLYQLGDYNNSDLDNSIFDESLALAINSFQLRHGLQADGILGRRTVREINKSMASRANQLAINLERARQLSLLQDDRYILVNVPEYKLYVIENGQTTYESKVIVGKKKNKTPVLSSVISEFVLNPYWNIPKSITRNEIIPKLQQDPDYLVRNDMKVITRLNNRNLFLNPYEVDWLNVDVDEAPLRIRQDPGKKNALGRIKFVFPNNYSVYLHDTPSRKLFDRNTRALSHGCVRVENPLKLAEVLLQGSPTWTAEELYKHANRNKTKVIKLENPIPVHITYMTAWVDDLGITQFRPDIYKRDSQIARN